MFKRLYVYDINNVLMNGAMDVPVAQTEVNAKLPLVVARGTKLNLLIAIPSSLSLHILHVS
jgi:hypothetical protein